MSNKERAQRIQEFGELNEPLRNIRLTVDGTWAAIELIPRQILQRSDNSDLESEPKEIQEALKDTRPIIEAAQLLRVEFENVRGLIVQEEFIDKLDLVADTEGLRDGNFATIIDSSWRATLEDYEMGDNADLKHFRIWSYETRVDVLGVLVGGEWLPNIT